MDGDSHEQKKYDSSSYPTGTGQHSALRRISGSSADRFRHPTSTRRITVDTTMPPQDGNAPLSSYGAFEYTESPSFNTPPIQGGAIQSGPLQYQQVFPTPPPRNSSQTTQPQPAQQEHQQRLQQYDAGMVYNMGPHAQPQSPYYQPRQSAAIEVLATQFGVPQYFPSDEPTGGAGASAQYLTAQDHSTAYPQPSVSRPNVATSFPESLAGFNAPASGTLEMQEPTRQPPSSIEDAYSRYQQMLRQTFQDIQIGRLVCASESLLEMSEWLLGNAAEIGLVRDDEDLHSDRINMWNEFNTCWLAVCQKQKDMTQTMLETGVQSTELLTQDLLQKLGMELVRLCDKMEQHGLVDYQMGVWEEEILSVLGNCLDLLESPSGSSSSGHRGHATATTTAH